MNQPVPSRIAGFTAADFAWNPAGYRPGASWRAGLADLGAELGGESDGEPGDGDRAEHALRVLADNSRSSALDRRESPTLRPLIDRFWRHWPDNRRYWPGNGRRRPGKWAGGSGDETLLRYFARMAAVPHVLRSAAHGGDGAAFLRQAGPWIEKTGRYGAAGRTALRMLRAARAGDHAGTARARRRPNRQRAALDRIDEHIAPKVMEPFPDRAEKEAEREAEKKTEQADGS